MLCIVSAQHALDAAAICYVRFDLIGVARTCIHNTALRIMCAYTCTIVRTHAHVYVHVAAYIHSRHYTCVYTHDVHTHITTHIHTHRLSEF